jgi:SAM-dependent methyltransferase
MPHRDETVDVVISNCVINLFADKPKVIREAARVLRPGGRFAVSDVIADPGMDATTRADWAARTGCIGGALTETEFRSALRDAGFEDIEILETHRIHGARRRRDHPRRQARGKRMLPSSTLSSCCEPDAKAECCGTPTQDAAPSSCACQG